MGLKSFERLIPPNSYYVDPYVVLLVVARQHVGFVEASSLNLLGSFCDLFVLP